MRTLPGLLLLSCTGDSVDTGAAAEPLSAARLEAQTAALVALGPRMVTTEAEARAADLIEEALLAAGLTPQRAPFAWEAWLPGAATVTLGGTRHPAEALSPSPATAGLAGALATEAVAGKIALYSSSDGSRADQFAAAFTGGAEAMIRITDDRTAAGEVLVEVGHTLQGSSLPAIAVDAEVGAALRAAVGQAVTLDIGAEVVDHVSDNLLAVVEGTGSGWVAVTAHYDSWHPSESAADNALGVAMLLLLAEAIAAERPERSVLFLLTSGEEQGLQGAFHWTRDNPDWADDIDQVINLDVPWASEGDLVCGATDPDWAEAAADAMAAEGLFATPADQPSPASDHFPFQARGADALWCARVPYREYHTDADTIDQINFSEAAGVLRAHATLLRDAVGLP